MNFINLLKFYILVLAVGLLLIPSAYADFNLTLQDIELETGITADINVVVFENNSSFCQKQSPNSINAYSIFAVHGIQLNALVWGPLANALFINNPTGGIVCRVVAIEMPGHGNSGLPQGGLLFGQMSEDNYTNVLLNSLTELAQVHNIRPISLLAHSNGGIVTQLAQQKLSGQGTNLSDEFGIQKITLLATVISAPVEWPIVQPALDLDILEVGCFHDFNFSPDCSTIDVVGGDNLVTWADILDIAATLIFNPIYDCDPATVPIGVPPLPAPPDPPCENSTVLGDRSPAGTLGAPDPEPWMIIREFTGTPPQVRPVTSSGIFGGEARATFQIVAFGMDELIGPPPVLQNLFNHLSVGTNSKFHIIGGPNSNHTMFFFTPEEFLVGLAIGDICLLPLPVVSPIPTLSEWGLIAMAGVLGIVGFMVMRRRKVAA